MTPKYLYKAGAPQVLHLDGMQCDLLPTAVNFDIDIVVIGTLTISSVIEKL
jgi:hypothetical protein